MSAPKNKWESNILTANLWIFIDLKYSNAKGFHDHDGNHVDTTYTPTLGSLPIGPGEFCTMLKFGKVDFDDCLVPSFYPSIVLCEPIE